MLLDPIRQAYSLRGGSLTSEKLPHAKKGENVDVYFNLNAMKRGLYGIAPVSSSEYEDLQAEAAAVFKKRKVAEGWSMTKIASKIKRASTDAVNMLLSGSIYSVRDPKGKLVIDHTRSVKLKDVIFATSGKTIASIRTKKSKTVCCVMNGEWEGKLTKRDMKKLNSWHTKIGQRRLKSEGWERVSFNPMRDSTFMSNGKPIFTAERVMGMTDLESPLGRPPALILAKGVNYTTKGWKRETGQPVKGVRRTRKNSRPVQALLFDRDMWSASQARSWIGKNGFIAPKLHKTENYLRFRQSDPAEFKKGSFRTIDFGEGIKAIVATRTNGSRDQLIKRTKILDACRGRNCRLFIYELLDVSSLEDFQELPFKVGDLKVGDVLKWWNGQHYAVSVGKGEVAEVEEWGGKPRVVKLAALLRSMDPPTTIYRKVRKNGARSGSKIDPNKMWYHGSGKRFKSFKTWTGRAFGSGESEVPIFFSPSKSFAEMNASGRDATIYTVKLDAKKVFDTENLYDGDETRYWPPEYDELNAEGKKVYGDLLEGRIFPDLTDDDLLYGEFFDAFMAMDYDIIETTEFKRWLKKNGYDGSFVRGDGEKNVFVFYPDQIKIVSIDPLRKRNPDPVRGLKTTLVPADKVRLKGFSAAKVRKVNKLLVPSLRAIERMAGHRVVFPSPVFAMTKFEIDEGRKTVDAGHPTGAGHGVFYPDFNIAKVNPHMDAENILANVIHEYLHFVFPRATEHDVDDMTAEITLEILGHVNNGSPPI